MRCLLVYLECMGKQRLVGTITGTSRQDAVFQYEQAYLPDGVPVSISLPLQKEPFSAEKTRCFFEGLLPEGFTRRSVANWLHADEEDYLTLLASLGKECLGALRVIDENDTEDIMAHYRRLTNEDVIDLASEGVSKASELVVCSHLSLTGASGKVGLYYNEPENAWYQPIGMAPSTHIVKQSHVRLNGIVHNEQLMLQTAANMGIPTSTSFIIRAGGTKDAEILLATKRYDRKLMPQAKMIDDISCPRRLHQENFAQALGISSSDKYETKGDSYLAKCFDLLRTYSANPIEDQKTLLDLLIYDVLIGNTDNHIKNLSLLYSDDLQSIRLAPAYDLVSTIIYKESSMEMSIAIGGELDWRKIKKPQFVKAAQGIGLSERFVAQEYDRLQESLQPSLNLAAKELSEQGFSGIKKIKKQLEEAKAL